MDITPNEQNTSEIPDVYEVDIENIDRNTAVYKTFPNLVNDIPETESDSEDEENEKDESAKKIIARATEAVAKLEEAVPKWKIIDLPPDKEIAYKQKFVPQCKLCRSDLRNDAEAIYARYNFVPNRVVAWLKSKGENFTWECIATHMKNHCIWDKPLISWPDRIIARQEELSPIQQNQIKWNIDAINVANLDLLSQIESATGEDAIKYYNAVCNGMKVQAQLMKLQHDTANATMQAKAMIEANNNKLVTFLDGLLKVVNAEQKDEIVTLIREFQSSEAKTF